jgi:hypothetical protein
MMTKLAFLLNRMPEADRLALCEQLGVSEATYYRMVAKPRRAFAWDQIEILKSYLDHRDGRDYDMAELMKPVNIAA